MAGGSPKKTLKWYLQGKQRIAYENCYRNNGHSAFLAKARTNSLQLEEHLGRGKPHYDKTCKLCGEEEEDIVHFTMKCKRLEKKRENPAINKDIIDPEERMKDLLFRNNNYAETRKVIRDLWVLRN